MTNTQDNKDTKPNARFSEAAAPKTVIAELARFIAENPGTPAGQQFTDEQKRSSIVADVEAFDNGFD